MGFRFENINRTIVEAQYDLRGPRHPLAGRRSAMSQKSLEAITADLAAGAMQLNPDGHVDDPLFVNYAYCSYEDYLAMCQQLASDCSPVQKEAIQLLIQEILRQHEKIEAEIASGACEKSKYLGARDKSTYWGRAILALMEAFEVTDADMPIPVPESDPDEDAQAPIADTHPKVAVPWPAEEPAAPYCLECGVQTVRTGNGYACPSCGGTREAD